MILIIYYIAVVLKYMFYLFTSLYVPYPIIQGRI